MDPELWQKVEALFDAAMAQSPDKRVEFLEQACPQDLALRLEVQALLDQRADSFLESSPLQSMLTPGTKPVAPKIAMVGTVLAQYQISEMLGEGGIGVVYRALDMKLNRPVAIKFLSGDLADAAARRRFQREAQMASSLNHPHILTVYDAGESEGRQYLVTEFVDGGTLRDWARAQKRDWREIVELLVGVVDGLATAHEAKILHRDIKPGNILVSKIGYAKLADFGLAKLEERSAVAAGEDTPTVTAETTRQGVL